MDNILFFFMRIFACIFMSVDATSITDVPDQAVCLGQTLILNWHFDETGILSVTWAKNNIPFMFRFGTDEPTLTDPPNNRTNYIDNGKINVTDVRRDDSGVYTIVVTSNSSADVSDSATVTVLESPSSINFSSIEEDDGRKYRCSVLKRGDPPVTVKIQVGTNFYDVESKIVNLEEPVDCCLQGQAVKCLANHTNGLHCKNIFTPYGPRNLTISPESRLYIFDINETLPTITCAAECDPPCQFTWTKSGFTLNTVNGILSSRRIKGHTDKGTYRCTAERSSSNPQFIDITVNVRYGPDNVTFHPSASEYTEREGELFGNISCISDCFPGCTYRWSNGTNIISHTNTLSLGVLDRSQAATYVCTVTNTVTDTKMENSLSLHVIYGPDSAILKPNTTMYIKNETDSLHDIKCEAYCYPQCKYSWSKGSTLLSQTDTLSIGIVNRSEAAAYTCTAQNTRLEGEAHKKRSSFTLYVVYGPDPGSVEINHTRHNFTENVGSQFPDISCLADCYPPCSYSWKKGEAQLSNSAILSLSSLQVNEAGTYICTAKNNNRGISAIITLDVHVRYGPGSIVLDPPDKRYEVSEGYYLPVISCTSDCYPGCSQTWRNVSGMSGQGQGNALALGTVNRYYTGKYECTSKNNAVQFPKNTTAYIDLTVKFFPDVTVTKLGDGSTTEKSGNFTLVCIATGVPDSYHYYNWTHYSPEKNVQIQEYQGQTLHKKLFLLRNDITYMDSGIYVCTVTNGEKKIHSDNTNATSNVEVIVKGKPHITRNMRIVDGATESSIKLNTSFYSNDGSTPSVRWYQILNNSVSEAIYADEKFNTSVFEEDVDVEYYQVYVIQKGFKAQLEIKYITESDFGTYLVEIENGIGITNDTVTLTPRGPPSGPVNFTVINGSETATSITLRWFPGFHGGSDQTFFIEYKTNTTQWKDAAAVFGGRIVDRHFNTTVADLWAATFYTFRIYSNNTFGRKNISLLTYGKTSVLSQVPEETEGGDYTATAVGAGIGTAIVTLGVILVVVFVKRRSLKTRDKDDVKRLNDSSSRKTEKAETDFEVNLNPMYESAGEVPSTSNNNIYAKVKKPLKKDESTSSADKNLYAEVKKPQKQEDPKCKTKKGKKVKPGKLDKKKDWMVYENAATLNDQSDVAENVYENPSCSTSDEKPMPGPSRTKNEDGLIYVEVEIPTAKDNADRKPVIHGLEDRNDYAEIAFGKVGEPAPESDDENDKKE